MKRIRIFAWKLLKSIDLPALYLKMDKEEDIRKIQRCILSISNGDREFACEILRRMNPTLRERLL